jgi:3-hydroxyacyl-[acyl-carrier-protein] dehydratase
MMPASLMLEGMAQTAGILVGSVRQFKEKVILAKVTEAIFESDVFPGQSIRYDAKIDRIDDMGASTIGTISRFDHRGGGWIDIGRTEIIFSHVDQNRAGLDLPEHNFVFGENFGGWGGGLRAKIARFRIIFARRQGVRKRRVAFCPQTPSGKPQPVIPKRCRP